MPEFVSECIQTWKRANPDFQVTVYTRKNLQDKLREVNLTLPENFDKVRAAYQADWVRLAILKHDGGIWVDASFIMTRSIQLILDIQEQEQTEGFMFYLDGWTHLPKFKYFENWFIASTPENSLISAWFQEFDWAFRRHGLENSYLDHLISVYGETQFKKFVQGNSMASYLKQHIALQKVLQIDGVKPFSGIDVADGNLGPLYLTALEEWEFERLAKAVLTSWPSDRYR
jgi:hypothetical protein